MATATATGLAVAVAVAVAAVAVENICNSIKRIKLQVWQIYKH